MPAVFRPLCLGAALLLATHAGAASFPVPPPGSDLIGAALTVAVAGRETLPDLARRYGLGFEEIVNANPGVDPWLPGAGTPIVLPRLRLLPAAPREGIVINLPEHRLYYFPGAPGGATPVVWTFPVSIGKMDWRTPLGVTRIVQKVRDPTWTPPQSVRDEHARRGDILPAIVPAGPNNPLGRHALRLGIPGGAYLIHGTNRPVGVGMQVTHGCMRLYPEDVEQLFGMVAVNTPVRIVNQPYKWGWHGGRLLIEVHPPLQEDAVDPPVLTDLMRLIVEATRGAPQTIDWPGAERIWREARGLPEAVSAGVAE